MQSGTGTERGLPPARKWRWTLSALSPVLALTAIAVSLSRAFRPEDPIGSVAGHLLVLAGILVVGLAVLELFARSRRRLREDLSHRFPDAVVVMTRSSGELADSIEAITGEDLSPLAPRSWVLGFVDRGTSFELWHLDRGKPRCLVHFAWEAVTAVSVGTADVFEAWERAVIITVGVDGRHFPIPISPVRENHLLAPPARDGRFGDVLTHIRAAHAASG